MSWKNDIDRSLLAKTFQDETIYDLVSKPSWIGDKQYITVRHRKTGKERNVRYGAIVAKSSASAPVIASAPSMATLTDLYFAWHEYDAKIRAVGNRGVNIPEIVTEGIVANVFGGELATGKGHNDVILPDGREIQVKASSIENDCSSFSPNSKYDILIFVHISPATHTCFLYNIPNSIDDQVLNKQKKETFADQAAQGRRPRLSLKKFCEQNGIQPFKTIQLKRSN